MYDYDFLVIGGGPAGHSGAREAASYGKRVALIEDRPFLGGACVHTGTVPSKSFREAALFLSGFRERTMYGRGFRLRSHVTMHDLTFRCRRIMQAEMSVVSEALRRAGVDVFHGKATFVAEHTINIASEDSSGHRLTADKVLLSTGARPYRPTGVPFDDEAIFDSDGILSLKELPKEMVVVGGGVIGTEYASMFAALGVRVTIVDGRPKLLGFVDDEIVQCLHYHLRCMGVTLALGDAVDRSERTPEGKVVTFLKSGKVLLSDGVLYSAGRQSNTDELGLENVGIEPDKRGRLDVDESYRTNVEYVYAAGDVIGFPALASTSALQGRLAAAHAFGESEKIDEIPLPYGIYSVPELSFVGPTEEELIETGHAHVSGTARYGETTRGNIIGDREGMLKLIFDASSQRLLAVHIIGEGATELVHIGQTGLALGAKVKYFVDTVFNYPTLAECYKIAALDAYRKIKRR